MATAYIVATAYNKATAKGHEANSISYLVLEIKRNLCLFCVWFTEHLISCNILPQNPFSLTLHHTWSREAKEPLPHPSPHFPTDRPPALDPRLNKHPGSSDEQSGGQTQVVTNLLPFKCQVLTSQRQPDSLQLLASTTANGARTGPTVSVGPNRNPAAPSRPGSKLPIQATIARRWFCFLT